MGWATLTIEVTPDLMESRQLARTGRVASFAKRLSWQDEAAREFSAPWLEQRSIVVRNESEGLRFRSNDLGKARIGDRLVLYGDRESPAGEAELHDGSTVMVQHFLQRADPDFVAALLENGTPSGDVVVGPTHDREGWEELRRRALDLAVEFEARGIASLVAASRFMEEQGAVLELRGPGGSVEGRVLAAEVLAERRGRARPERPRVPDYSPVYDADRLLRVLESHGDAFGETGTRSDALTLLQQVSQRRPE